MDEYGCPENAPSGRRRTLQRVPGIVVSSTLRKDLEESDEKMAEIERRGVQSWCCFYTMAIMLGLLEHGASSYANRLDHSDIFHDIKMTLAGPVRFHNLCHKMRCFGLVMRSVLHCCMWLADALSCRDRATQGLGALIWQKPGVHHICKIYKCKSWSWETAWCVRVVSWRAYASDRMLMPDGIVGSPILTLNLGLGCCEPERAEQQVEKITLMWWLCEIRD
jgi:hypothetical protein